MYCRRGLMTEVPERPPPPAPVTEVWAYAMHCTRCAPRKLRIVLTGNGATDMRGVERSFQGYFNIEKEASLLINAMILEGSGL